MGDVDIVNRDDDIGIRISDEIQMTSRRHSHSFTLILAFSHSLSASGSGIVLYRIDHHELSNTGTIFASVAFLLAPTVPSLANDSLHSHSLAMTRSTATMTMPPWMRQDS
ncbi:hypothetical protein BYT27DRAFT_7257860 [Phlegmacium glaucopus]|nr:hypothetical protein BYT27DRAFT_7257860 [Phlegmacium glaucopus]